ncbi:MAG TPA: hypothetical protein VF933_37850 [Streptosporangiaceae bacterium]
MNDPDVITAVKASYAGIHMDVPLDAIVRRGRRLRAQRRLPGLAGAAGTVAALALALAALVPGSGRATAPGGSTGTAQLAAWTVVSQQDGSVRVALRGAYIRDVAGLQDRLRRDGIPARVARIGYQRSPLNVPGCHVFGYWSAEEPAPPGEIPYALWHKIFYGPHTGPQSIHAFWVYRSAIPRGLGALVDIYYDGTYGLYVVKASPQCTGTEP